MASIADEIAAFDEMKADLEAEHFGEWVVFHARKLIKTYKDFESAASDAVEQFGAGPYLIRQIGAPPMSLPASLMSRPAHAQDASWV
jgi:hypothetical protein